VGVYEFHNRHGSQQKEQNAGDFLHMVEEPVLKEDFKGAMASVAMIKSLVCFQQVSRCFVPTQHEHGPAEGSRDQCTGSLVDVQVVFKRNEQVSNDENDDK